MKPKVFVNFIDKSIKNNKDVYHFTKEEDIVMIDESVNIRSKLNDIFNSDSFVYKSRVEIYLKNGSILNEEVIAIKDNNLITLSNKLINIDDIINIKKAN